MSKGRHAFKLNNAARFMVANAKAAKAAGLPPERLRYVLNPLTGEITSMMAEAPATADGNCEPSNPWDKVLTDAADQERST
jgi:hypothetical protein